MADELPTMQVDSAPQSNHGEQDRIQALEATIADLTARINSISLGGPTLNTPVPPARSGAATPFAPARSGAATPIRPAPSGAATPIPGGSHLNLPVPGYLQRITAPSFGDLTARELAKQSLQLPEKSKLTGPNNYQQWLQAISIQLRALNIGDFLKAPLVTTLPLNDPERAALLLTLRNTIKEGPLATIAFEVDPAEAFLRLQAQYAPQQTVLRNELYSQFHSLKFDGSTSVVDFNALFNTLVSRLSTLKVEIQDEEQLSVYFAALEAHFPQ